MLVYTEKNLLASLADSHSRSVLDALYICFLFHIKREIILLYGSIDLEEYIPIAIIGALRAQFSVKISTILQ